MDGDANIKRGRKFDQVVAGARDVFMGCGFEGASVDVIARNAGVSKATLYSYFPDKRALFIEVATQECKRQAQQALTVETSELPVRDVLAGVGQNMILFLTSPFAQQIFRICVAESERFPELGREFYQTGPNLMRDRLVAYFKMACARGELTISDLNMAACQFQELVKADLFTKMVFNITDTVPQVETERVVGEAVDTFLARYGT